MWNYSSFPAYKSRFWDMAGSTGGEESVKEKKK